MLERLRLPNRMTTGRALRTVGVLTFALACARADVSLEDLRSEAAEPPAPPGRWRRVPSPETPPGLSAEQRAQIEDLEAIGYLSGSVAASDRVGVTVHDSQRAHAGLNLVVSGHAPEAYLMDMEGRVLHRWSRTFESVWPQLKVTKKVRKNGHMWRRAHLYPDGDLLAIFEGIGLVRLDRASGVEWAFGENAHHDVDVGPEGRIYVLTRSARLVPRFHPSKPVLEDFVTILSPTGEVLRRVSVMAALADSPFASTLDRARDTGGDVLHTNTVELLDGGQAHRSGVFRRGNVLVSMRNVDLLAILDLERERAVWALTGPWRAQHQPVLLEGGTMLLFDNAIGRPGGSRVLELDPLGGEVVWSYEAGAEGRFFSRCCGSNQRLPNGNTLITETDYGRAFEVTADGAIVWEYLSPFRTGQGGELVASLFEVVRIDPGSLDGAWPSWTHGR
jgi:hypothetical protein